MANSPSELQGVQNTRPVGPINTTVPPPRPVTRPRTLPPPRRRTTVSVPVRIFLLLHPGFRADSASRPPGNIRARESGPEWNTFPEIAPQCFASRSDSLCPRRLAADPAERREKRLSDELPPYRRRLPSQSRDQEQKAPPDGFLPSRVRALRSARAATRSW